MIRIRTAAALTAGTVAALAVGGAAFASERGGDAVPMLPNGDVIATSAAEPTSSATVTPSASASDSLGSSGSSGSSDDSSAGVGGSSGSAGTGAPTPSSAASSGSASSGAARAGAISLDAAKMIAVQAAGGGRVTDVERETEHGRAVWDVEVRNGSVEHDIDIDRATGEVVQHKQDADDDRDDRDDSDDRDDRDDRDDDRDDRGDDD